MMVSFSYMIRANPDIAVCKMYGGSGSAVARANEVRGHIKTDILRLQIIHYFKNFAFMFEKRDVYASVF